MPQSQNLISTQLIQLICSDWTSPQSTSMLASSCFLLMLLFRFLSDRPRWNHHRRQDPSLFLPSPTQDARNHRVHLATDLMIQVNHSHTLVTPLSTDQCRAIATYRILSWNRSWSCPRSMNLHQLVCPRNSLDFLSIEGTQLVSAALIVLSSLRRVICSLSPRETI